MIPASGSMPDNEGEQEVGARRVTGLPCAACLIGWRSSNAGWAGWRLQQSQLCQAVQGRTAMIKHPNLSLCRRKICFRCTQAARRSHRAINRFLFYFYSQRFKRNISQAQHMIGYKNSSQVQKPGAASVVARQNAAPA